MKIEDRTTPVVILNCKLAALGIMRSLGSRGIQIYGVDTKYRLPGMVSRYCKRRFVNDLDGNNPQKYLDYLINIGEQIGGTAILIPTSDETAVFVAEHSDQLREQFIFPRNNLQIIRKLVSKKGMFELATQYNIPTPNTVFPQDINDILSYMENGTFPVMLKGILGNCLEKRTGKKMVIVHSKEELLKNYKSLEIYDTPNLMLQEYIPGGDDHVYIFNGYFNEKSECLAAFTGHKIRQFPIHVGCASLGICTWNQDVADITIRFMQLLGYQGILDIGYRLDTRDGVYKVLDVNPRIGQAFRLFVAENGMDVVRALYMDLTGQKPRPIVPIEGRRWLIEDFDIVSTIHYFQEGSISFSKWFRSFKNVKEMAWFSWKDPNPFFLMVGGLLKKVFIWLKKKCFQ